jgi:hypothetical protein
METSDLPAPRLPGEAETEPAVAAVRARPDDDLGDIPLRSQRRSEANLEAWMRRRGAVAAPSLLAVAGQHPDSPPRHAHEFLDLLQQYSHYSASRPAVDFSFPQTTGRHRVFRNWIDRFVASSALGPFDMTRADARDARQLDAEDRLAAVLTFLFEFCRHWEASERERGDLSGAAFERLTDVAQRTLDVAEDWQGLQRRVAALEVAVAAGAVREPAPEPAVAEQAVLDAQLREQETLLIMHDIEGIRDQMRTQSDELVRLQNRWEAISTAVAESQALVAEQSDSLHAQLRASDDVTQRQWTSVNETHHEQQTRLEALELGLGRVQADVALLLNSAGLRGTQPALPFGGRDPWSDGDSSEASCVSGVPTARSGDEPGDPGGQQLQPQLLDAPRVAVAAPGVAVAARPQEVIGRRATDAASATSSAAATCGCSAGWQSCTASCVCRQASTGCTAGWQTSTASCVCRQASTGCTAGWQSSTCWWPRQGPAAWCDSACACSCQAATDRSPAWSLGRVVCT